MDTPRRLKRMSSQALLMASTVMLSVMSVPGAQAQEDSAELPIAVQMYTL